MNKDIKVIFDSITPDNIKEIPAIRDAMDIFIETLEELSKESIDIKNVYENPNIKEQLVKTYLNDLYSVLKQVQLNDQLRKSIDKVNSYYELASAGVSPQMQFINRDAIDDIANYVTEEHFFSFKSFKQHKGTKAAIEYIYELIRGFVISTNEPTPLVFREGKDPFHLEIDGPLPVEFYEYIVHPLAHPLGFTYAYERYIFQKLEDFFPCDWVEYNTNVLEVRCLFPDGSTKTTPYINNLISDSERDRLGIDPELKIVDIKDSITASARIRLVFLSNGKYLKQEALVSGQIRVWEMEGDGGPNDIITRTFSEQCSIYLDYTPTHNTRVLDDLLTTIHSFSSDSVPRLSIANFTALDELRGIDIEKYIHGDRTNDDKNTLYSSLLISDVSDEYDSGTDIGSNDIGDFIKIDIDSLGPSFRSYLDQDGNYIPDGLGRIELLFAPSWISDIKILEGKYTYNYPVKNDSGQVIYTQPLKYTDTVHQTPSITQALSLDVYIDQNIGNEDFLAREHKFTQEEFFVTNAERSILYEMAYVPTDNFIDYNGDDRGSVEIPPLRINSFNVGVLDYDIGSYGVGEFNDEKSYILSVFETLVNGDAVNLQYGTIEQILTTNDSLIVDEYDDIDEELSTSNAINISDDSFSRLSSFNMDKIPELNDVNFEKYVHGDRTNDDKNTLYSPLLISGTDIGSDNIGDFTKIDIDSLVTSFRSYLDQDGNYIPDGLGRIELLFAPSWISDIKILEGKYTYNYPVKNDSGQVIYTQPLKYTDDVHQTPSITQALSLDVYIDQNIGNEDFLAREHKFTQEEFFVTNAERSILYEMAYVPTDSFIDYNGDDRGSVEIPPLRINSFNVGVHDYDIGSYGVGEFNDEKSYILSVFETLVNGDAVNLQYRTIEQTLTINDSLIVDEYDDIKDELSTSNVVSTFDAYGFYVIEHKIFDTLYIESRPFYNVLDYQTTSAAVDVIYGVTEVFQEVESHIEADSSEPWALILDDENNIIGGNDWIGYKKIIVQTIGESYVNEDFNQDSDADFAFGVYRDGVLLHDNNIHAIA